MQNLTIAEIKKPVYKCDFCQRTFKREATFLNHYCYEREKFDILKTDIGQTAWDYYQQWMKKKYFSKNTDIGVFYYSSLFRSFVNFTKFAMRIQISHIKIYINVMISNGFDPKWWCRDDIYAIYLVKLDYYTSPEEQLNTSILTMRQCADLFRTDFNKVFEVIDGYNILELIRKRQLMPWFLLNYRPFGDFLKSERITEDQVTRLQEIIRTSYWAKEFQSKAALRAKIIQQLKDIS